MTHQPSDGKPREEVETKPREAGRSSHADSLRVAPRKLDPITVTVPIRIESLNKTYTEHWRVRSNRNTSHQWATHAALKAAKVPHDFVPCIVTLTRIAPRSVDKHDNLRAGFKSPVDAVAYWLGVDDANPLVEWRYSQRRGKPHEYAAEIRIESRP